MNNYQAQSQGHVQSLMYRVFGWMAFALSLTGFTAYFVSGSPAFMSALVNNSFLLFGLIGVQLLLVVTLSFAITKLSYAVAFSMFSLYAVLTGVTLSTIFMVYTTGSLVGTFFVAAGMFAAMAIYGAVTKSDLTAMGSFLMMMLFGLIIAMFVNMFVQSAALDLVTAMIGVVVFAGLTAWDVQKLQQIAQRIDMRDARAGNIALILALQLYLDFINLFLSLLRIMGERKK
jgi:hypothetical protein